MSTETLTEKIAEGEIDTTDTPVRYLGYLARIRPLLLPFSRYTRYLAYTSDVGEAARPIVHPNIVKGAYMVSWSYVLGDVAYEGYKTHMRAKELCPEYHNGVVGLGVAKRALFQSTASMLFPAFTIHTIVKQVGKAINNSATKNVFLRTWGGSLSGLAFIPALPYIFDEPAEIVFDKVFDTLEDKIYGNSPAIHEALNGGPHTKHSAKSDEKEKTD